MAFYTRMPPPLKHYYRKRRYRRVATGIGIGAGLYAARRPVARGFAKLSHLRMAGNVLGRLAGVFARG